MLKLMGKCLRRKRIKENSNFRVENNLNIAASPRMLVPTQSLGPFSYSQCSLEVIFLKCKFDHVISQNH